MFSNHVIKQYLNMQNVCQCKIIYVFWEAEINKTVKLLIFYFIYNKQYLMSKTTVIGALKRLYVIGQSNDIEYASSRKFAKTKLFMFSEKQREIKVSIFVISFTIQYIFFHSYNMFMMHHCYDQHCMSLCIIKMFNQIHLWLPFKYIIATLSITNKCPYPDIIISSLG